MWDKITGAFSGKEEEPKTENNQGKKNGGLFSRFLNIEFDSRGITGDLFKGGNVDLGSRLKINISPEAKMILGVLGGGILLYLFYKNKKGGRK